jgi:serpin B
MKLNLTLLLAIALAMSACTAGAPTTPTSTSPTPPPTVPSTAPPATATASPETADIREIRAELGRAPLGSASPATVAAVVAADADFAFDLYREFVASETGNLFFSPYSISTALSMTWAGARENTADQLAAALGIDVQAGAWHAARNAIELQLAGERRTWEDLQPIELEPTNTTFGQAGHPFIQEFLDTLAAYYGAGMQTVDFINQPEPARQAINDWVSERTRERIEELLPRDSIDDMTRLVLVNAIFFKANWIDQFEPDLTRDGEFTLLDGSQVTAPMMHGSPSTEYAAGDGWQAVSLPYVGDASMLVIVPDEGRFADIEGGLDASFVEQVRGQLGHYLVQLSVPRWESASEIDLQPALKALGVVDLFDWEKANLDGMAQPVDNDLYASAALHQANITVDEDGTEAAAATAVIVGVTGGPPDSVTLDVDRPFVYLITDDLTGEILFVGRLLDPSGD